METGGEIAKRTYHLILKEESIRTTGKARQVAKGGRTAPDKDITDKLTREGAANHHGEGKKGLCKITDDVRKIDGGIKV